MSQKSNPSVLTKKADLRELQRKQLEGEDVAQLTGNTPEGADYTFPAHEADRVHIRTTKKVNNPEKRQYEDVVDYKKLVPAQFDRMKANGYFDTQTYDKVEVLYDRRLSAGAKAPDTTSTGAKPWQPAEGLPTLQDAQVRYKQLTGKNAPAVDYDTLILFIQAAEADADEQTTETDEDDDTTPRKPVRSLADAQAYYKEVFQVDAPADKTFTELKQLIEAELALRDKPQD